MSLRDRLPAAQTQGPISRLQHLVNNLPAKTAEELCDLIRDDSIEASRIARLCTELAQTDLGWADWTLRGESVARIRREERWPTR